MVDRATVHRRRWQILAVLCLSLTLIGLDNLILTLAIPSIQADLGASVTDLQWTIDAYTLPFGGLLLFAGGLADRLGRKRILLAGLAVFLAFSIAAAFADTTELLIAARAGMGIGGALMMPSTLSIIKDVFPAGEQAKAIGIWAGAGALGVPLGPIVGGLLLERYWWGSVFLVNVPVVLVALIVGALLIPESRAARSAKLDLVGVLLSTGGLFALVYGIINGPHEGWGNASTVTLLILGVLLLAAFVAWQRRTPNPMLSGELFSNRQFSGSAVAVVLVNFALFGLLFVVTQFLQFVLGYGPMSTGLRLLTAVTIVVGAGAGVQLVDKLGLKATVTTGMLITAVSMATLANATTSSQTHALAAVALFGLGMGLVMPACANAILAASPAHQSGAGAAVTDAGVQIGGTLGIAVIGSVLTTAYQNALPGTLPGVPTGEPTEAFTDSIGGAHAVAGEVATQAGGASADALRELAATAFVSGLSDAMYLGAGVAVIAAILSLFMLPRKVVDVSAAEAPEPEPEGITART